MNFLAVIDGVIRELDKVQIRYALIGGFAMALRGVQRSTIDLDFILMLEDLDQADRIFRQAGYRRAYRSENVSHYVADDRELGRIDILHAFRGPSLSMLSRAERIPVSDQLSLPVVQIEDLIGLKIQAAHNDPSRNASDWSDIRLLIELSARMHRAIDWELLEDYLELFGESDKLKEMRSWHDSVDTNG